MATIEKNSVINDYKRHVNLRVRNLKLYLLLRDIIDFCYSACIARIIRLLKKLLINFFSH